MRIIAGAGLAFCSVALLLTLLSYHNLSSAGVGNELNETLRALFWGFILFPVGIILSFVLWRRQPR